MDEEENTIVRLCLQLICPESPSSSSLYSPCHATDLGPSNAASSWLNEKFPFTPLHTLSKRTDQIPARVRHDSPSAVALSPQLIIVV